jgi:hypothetical protein
MSSIKDLFSVNFYHTSEKEAYVVFPENKITGEPVRDLTFKSEDDKILIRYSEDPEPFYSPEIPNEYHNFYVRFFITQVLYKVGYTKDVLKVFNEEFEEVDEIYFMQSEKSSELIEKVRNSSDIEELFEEYEFLERFIN